MLTDAELEEMRDVAAQALPGTAVITLGGTLVSDGGGGGSISYTSGGTVACRVAPISGTEREIADRISSDAEFVITLPHSANVTTDAKLAISGSTYSVEAIRDRSYEITTRVEAVKDS